MSKEKLTENSVKKASCPSSPSSIDHYYGKGLVLRVSRNGVKNWRYRYKIDGAKKTLTLGTCPTVNFIDDRK
jgi:hypothetical protein